MNATVRLLAWTACVHVIPASSEAQLRRRLADLLLGPDLAARVYGPLAAEAGLTQEQRLVDSKAVGE